MYTYPCKFPNTNTIYWLMTSGHWQTLSNTRKQYLESSYKMGTEIGENFLKIESTKTCLLSLQLRSQISPRESLKPLTIIPWTYLIIYWSLSKLTWTPSDVMTQTCRSDVTVSGALRLDLFISISQICLNCNSIHLKQLRMWIGKWSRWLLSHYNQH